jgi:hypothetical protein
LNGDIPAPFSNSALRVLVTRLTLFNLQATGKFLAGNTYQLEGEKPSKFNKLICY